MRVRPRGLENLQFWFWVTAQINSKSLRNLLGGPGTRQKSRRKERRASGWRHSFAISDHFFHWLLPFDEFYYGNLRPETRFFWGPVPRDLHPPHLGPWELGLPGPTSVNNRNIERARFTGFMLDPNNFEILRDAILQAPVILYRVWLHKYYWEVWSNHNICSKSLEPHSRNQYIGITHKCK